MNGFHKARPLGGGPKFRKPKFRTVCLVGYPAATHTIKSETYPLSLPASLPGSLSVSLTMHHV